MIEGQVTYNSITLNAPAFTHHTILGSKQPGAWQSPFYWYRLIAVDGLWSDPVLNEVVQLPYLNPAGMGQTRSGDRYTSGKTIVLTGTVEAQNLAALRTGQIALRNAFTDMVGVHDLGFKLGSTALRLKAGYPNQQLQMPEQQNSMLWKRAWAVQLYFDDPTIYTSGGGAYTGWV